MKRLAAAAIVLAVFAAFGAVLLVPGETVHWVGSKVTELEVLVTDADTNKPVPNASVRLFRHEHDGFTSRGQTDASGRLQLTHEFKAIGSESRWEKKGMIYLDDTMVVEANGYKSIRDTLDEYTPGYWKLYRLPLPQVEVRLKKK